VENAEVVRSFYERVGSGDLPGGLALVDEDCRWIEMESFGHAGVYVGPGAIRDNIFVRIGSEWDDFSVSVDDVLDGGDAVFGTGTYAGTCKATGRRFEARVVHRFDVRDGKIVQFEQFTDSAAIAAARES
jgi:ketosteroid isomerase-like protein